MSNRGMRAAMRAAVLTAAVGLTGCSSLTQIVNPLTSAQVQAQAEGLPTLEAATPIEAAPGEPAPPVIAPLDPDDDLALGKRHFVNRDYGLAEQFFRRAVEKGLLSPTRDAEAWVGLAASYDRLKRFDLADRAYRTALRRFGPSPEILNNQGYSYFMRGDYAMARTKLMLASAGDPSNPYIRNNLALLDGRKEVTQ